MYQMYDLEMWQEHSRELRREAEKSREARLLRSTRPQEVSRATHGQRFAGLRRATAMWSRTSVPFFRA